MSDESERFGAAYDWGIDRPKRRHDLISLNQGEPLRGHDVTNGDTVFVDTIGSGIHVTSRDVGYHHSGYVAPKKNGK